MAIRHIIYYPDPVLLKKADTVSGFNAELNNIFDDMVETMFAAKGVGLAAPQIGISMRIAVIDADIENRGSRILRLVNPVIIEAKGKISWREGCLSIPGLDLDVERRERVVMEALNENGDTIREEASGFLAIAIQHEIDHLDGTLILERVSALKRNFYRKKIMKHGLPLVMDEQDRGSQERTQLRG